MQNTLALLTKTYAAAVFGVQARTIADLRGANEIGSGDLAEAIQYRSLDRESWAG